MKPINNFLEKEVSIMGCQFACYAIFKQARSVQAPFTYPCYLECRK
jgi:hypothetical protein